MEKMVLGEGENFFSREKPNVGFGVPPSPNPNLFLEKRSTFFSKDIPYRRLSPHIGKTEPKRKGAARKRKLSLAENSA